MPGASGRRSLLALGHCDSGRHVKAKYGKGALAVMRHPCCLGRIGSRSREARSPTVAACKESSG